MGLDSIELVLEVEKHFSIIIPDREAEKVYTVGKMVDCVANIIGADKYDFTIRDKFFQLVKSTLQTLRPGLPDFSLSAKVAETIDLDDIPFLSSLQNELQLQLPGIDITMNNPTGILPRLQHWFRYIEKIDFSTITWKKYINIILAFNLDKLNPKIQYTSKYEIYIAVMRITVDKTGVDYEDVGIEKSFTDDLGID